MDLAAFADELVKIGADEKRRKKHTNYLRSALVGAAGLPITSIANAAISRKLHNHHVMREIAKTPGRADELAKTLRKGPLVPKADLAGQAAAGAVGGSLVQWLREKLVNQV